MAVTAAFLQDPFELFPGAPAGVTLRLHNDGVSGRSIDLATTGPLADYATISATETAMATNEIVDVPITVEVPATFEPGSHALIVEVSSRMLVGDPAASAIPSGTSERVEPTSGDVMATSIATATARVVENPAFTVELHPVRSRGSSAGRHRVRVVNAGNVGVTVDIQPEEPGPGITVEVPIPSLTTTPGATAEADVRVVPSATFWSGPIRVHDFVVRADASDGSSEALPGTYEQRPRVAGWLGPAAAGAIAALLLGTIAWFAFLKPWVEDTADQAAAEAIELDRIALQERIEQLEAAAAEAEELPLGTPTDLQLSVDPTGGNTDTDLLAVDLGETLSVTDLVFQNPTGAVGTASLLRDGDVLLSFELANFRDFDLHLVAPYTFDASSEIALEVTCRTPGTDGTGCPVNLSIVGFVDEANR